MTQIVRVIPYMFLYSEGDINSNQVTTISFITILKVAPCTCSGSSKWVHRACLEQWQKSILLTQSTHPLYQSSIDEICNICKKPFKNEFKPKSRGQHMMEWTGEELHGVIAKGNLIVPNRKESDQSKETMEK
jgi:hypothetical protein